MSLFREGKTRLLISTDMAARGLDVPEVIAGEFVFLDPALKFWEPFSRSLRPDYTTAAADPCTNADNLRTVATILLREFLATRYHSTSYSVHIRSKPVIVTAEA